MFNPKTGFLIPPYGGNAGDGSAGNARETTAEEIREQIEGPIRNARAGAWRDAISYLIHNATSDADDFINVRQAINARWNISWTESKQLGPSTLRYNKNLYRTTPFYVNCIASSPRLRRRPSIYDRGRNDPLITMDLATP